MSNDERSRTYPTRPYLAVSAIFRDGRVLIVRRARPPAHGSSCCPAASSRRDALRAVIRDVREETSPTSSRRLAIYPGDHPRCRGRRRAAFRDFASSRRAGSPARLRSTSEWRRNGANRRRPTTTDLKTTEGLAADVERGPGADRRGAVDAACLNHAVLSCLLDRPLAPFLLAPTDA